MIYLASLNEKVSDRLNGYSLISTREELDRVVADNTKADKVIIRSDFATEYFTPRSLKKFLDNIKVINLNITVQLEESTEVSTLDDFIQRLADVNTVDDMFYYMSHYSVEMLDALKVLVSKNVEVQKEALQSANSQARLQGLVDELKGEVSSLKYALRTEQTNKYNAQTKLDVLVRRINNQYNKGIDQQKLFLLNSNSYDKIIYIKELTRVQYVDSLVKYLKEVMKILYHMPTKVCVVESYYSEGKESLYKEYVPQHRLSERDVVYSDILMFGLQPNLMTDILRNSSGISLLIVLDRGGYKTPHITGENVEYIYTISNLEELPSDIPKDRVISYSEESMFIPYIKGFNEMEEFEKVSKYSSTQIVKKLVKLAEGRC